MGEVASAVKQESATVQEMSVMSVKILSAMRITFGVIFLFDGMLKWYLFATGQMQDLIAGYGYDFLTNNWVAVGTLVAVGETAAGMGLILGIFQKPSAIVGAAIMFLIWGFGGFEGLYTPDGGWAIPAGFTDPGGDLMLAIVFTFLVFAPTAYGLAARYRLRERWNTSSTRDRALRFLVA